MYSLYHLYHGPPHIKQQQHRKTHPNILMTVQLQLNKNANTVQGLSLTTLTLALAFLADITLSPTIFHAKNLLSTTSTPMSLLITLLYFSLRLIDPELVIPAELALPLPTDLSFHLTPTLALLIDILFFSPPWTITVLPACAFSGFIATGYWWWVERCYERNGYYPYPIFDLVGFEGRVALFVGSAVSMVLGTVVLKALQGRVMGVGRVGYGSRPGKAANGKAL
jgi:hypothetical protein